MLEMGYVPQMKREFSLIQLIGSAYTLTNSWLGVMVHSVRMKWIWHTLKVKVIHGASYRFRICYYHRSVN
jgi:hypothetical protein